MSKFKGLLKEVNIIKIVCEKRIRKIPAHEPNASKVKTE